MPKKISRAVTIALLPLAFALRFPGSAQAQVAASDPLIHLTPQKASTFSSAFTALSQQAHAAVVAEDQPLHMILTPQAASGLRLSPDGEALSTLLPKLAAAYDYTVQSSGKVVLLKKRYTDPADLPSVTVKECALGLAEASRYLDNFNPHFPKGEIDDSPAMKDLIYSLTPEQLEAMGDNKRGVPVASLAPEHQQEVAVFLLHFYIQRSTRNFSDTVDAINRVAAGDPQFSWRSMTAITDPSFAHRFLDPSTLMFGYDAVLPSGQNIFMTLSKPDQIQTFLTGGIKISPRADAGTPPDAARVAPGDVTDPLPVPASAPPPAPPVSSSLAEIIARLNTRAKDGLKVSVESYLAPKRATVFGEATAAPREELNALADLYGLRVLTEEKQQGKDRLRLTRQTARVPLDVIAMHDSLLQSLSDPLVRACRMHSAFAPFNPNAISPIPSGLSPLFVYAVRQIRTAAEPKIRASKDGKVALSALSEQEGRAFAVTLMVAPMESLSDLTRAALPKEFTEFNDLRLSGGLHEENGKQWMSLMLALPNPNDPSTLQAGIGVGGINYDPVNHTL